MDRSRCLQKGNSLASWADNRSGDWQAHDARMCLGQHWVLVRANPSLEPTRYGRQRKAGLRYSVHFLCPALRLLPTRAAQLER